MIARRPPTSRPTAPFRKLAGPPGPSRRASVTGSGPGAVSISDECEELSDGRATVVAAPVGVPLPAHAGAVDPAPDHRAVAGHRPVRPGVLAGERRGRRE